MPPKTPSRRALPAVVAFNRGIDLERRGLCDAAVDAYREAVRLDPGDVDAQVRLGLLLREAGRDEEANRAFQAALALQAGPLVRGDGQRSIVWDEPLPARRSGTIKP